MKNAGAKDTRNGPIQTTKNQERKMMSKEISAGIAIILAIAIVLAGVVGYRIFREHNSSYNLTIMLPKTDGLEKGSEVRYLGVKTGYVARVGALNRNAYAEIKVDKKTKIPTDSRIEVNRIGLFSEQIISIFPGNRNEYYAANDTIKVESVDTIPQFSGLSTAANAVVGVGNMMLQKEIISKLDTVIALLKEKD